MKSLIKKMITVIVILTAAESLAAVFFYPRFSIGVLLGGGGALVNILSLWYDINRSLKRRRLVRGYAGRYAFSGSLMLVGGLISVETLFGVFVGLMNMKLSAYIVGWREKV